MGRYTCGKCNRVCARNVAFCYAVEFGAQLYEQRAFDILEGAGLPAVGLRTDKEVAQVAQFKYRAREFDSLAQEGLFLPLTHANDKRREDLSSTEADIAREVKDAKTAFGDNDPLVFDLSVMHVEILLNERKLEQAEDMLLYLERAVEGLAHCQGLAESSSWHTHLRYVSRIISHERLTGESGNAVRKGITSRGKI